MGRSYAIDILSIGEAMVEMSATGDLQSAQTFIRGYGGDTFNTAMAAARLGCQVGYLTRVAPDPFGDSLLDVMVREGFVTDEVVKMTPGFTGLYFVLRSPQTGERTYWYYRRGSSASFLCEADVLPHVVQSAKIVFSSGITLSLSDSARQAVLKAFRIAKESGIMTAFDLNYRAALWPSPAHAFEAITQILPYVDVLLPTLPDDTDPLLGLDRPDQVMDYFMTRGVPLVVAKRGAEGCLLGFKGSLQAIPAYRVQQVVDAIGAGDAFNAGFLHGLINKKSLIDCAELAVVTAGLKVESRGSALAMPSMEAVYSQFLKLKARPGVAS